MVPYEPTPASRGDIITRMGICNDCEFNGVHLRNGQTFEGCGLLSKPCSIERKRMDREFTGPPGRKCWDAAADPLPCRFPTDAAPYVDETQLLRDTQVLLGKVASLPIKMVVGVPRSGMVPATYIALRLGLPLGTMIDGEIRATDTGWRLRSAAPDDESSGRILVVEDSSASGRSVSEVRHSLRGVGGLLLSAVYSTPTAAKGLDYYGRLLPLPHWFSWNLFGNQTLFRQYRTATDLDGVLCPDCDSNDDDDGDRYQRWMRRVKPMVCTRKEPIPFIVTARLEKYRRETEQWLWQHHFRWGELIMGPWESKTERTRHCIGTWKREKAIEAGARMFIESDDRQARIISNHWDYPVISIEGKTSYHRGQKPQWPIGITQF